MRLVLGSAETRCVPTPHTVKLKRSRFDTAPDDAKPNSIPSVARRSPGLAPTSVRQYAGEHEAAIAFSQPEMQ
ncbi:hypothetical protein MAPG_03293 [Magnaporthiopsis poae ATCC 64411]|uniref:Uncharacterized protein n=1 Tax=Magnaporthiopsis poae (strain ATCC 64411 / 73-15) TaxID=644358 RepID=A0A0C4DTM2_MAGP6|nr:hypothetical protein MAPG_03293 [Magnaporthiopsis poae ATCC 64411]